MEVKNSLTFSFVFDSIKNFICSQATLLIIFLSIPIVSFAQIQTGSFVFEGILRDYIVFLPQNYNGIAKLPVVFNLHGITLSAQQQMDYSRMNSVADTAGFIVVYPNAVDASWNCGISYVTHNVNDVGFFGTLIDTLASHYSIDKEKVYSCGFSLGGFMSYTLACQLSNRIAAIADVAGVMAKSLLNNTSTLHSMPVLKIHGTADQIVPYNGAYDWCSVPQTINHWTSFNLCNPPDTTSIPNIDTLDGCTVQKIRYSFCTDSVQVIFYKVIGGGHSWPGGDKQHLYLSWGTIGTTNADINASELIWNFFKDYKLSTNIPVELISFTAVANGKELTLNWTTATEMNNQGFEVQRKFASNDFVTVGSVKGHGTTTSPNNYTYIDKLIDGGKYFYRLKQIDFSGTFEYSDVIEVEVRSVDKFALEQNYPNPFNPTTTIGYVLQEKSAAKLTLLNSLGEEVAVLVNEEQDKGYHKVEFDGSKLTSGVYFYRIQSGSFIDTKKMALLK